MAGNWYLGGVLRTEQQNSAWISADMRASLVAGNNVIQNDRGWQTMFSFTGAGNSFITNMTSGTATDVVIPGTRTISYDSVTDTVYWRWPAGRISFGTPEIGQPFCGVLIHEGLVTEPAATIWGYQRVTGTTQGGVVEWGEATAVNDVLTANARNTLNANTGNGFMKGIFNDRIDSWSDNTDPTDLYEFSLVQTAGNISNFRDWYSVLDALSDGMTFCTNCGWGENQEYATGGNPVLTAANRDNSGYFGNEQYFYYPTASGGVTGGLKWLGSELSGGENAVGILGYVLGGTTATSPILMWNDIPSPITLVNGQDVIWDSFDVGDRRLVRSYLTGN